MMRVSNFLRKTSNSIRGLRFLSHQGVKAIEDHDLLDILRSEINYELTSEPSKTDGNGSLGDFVIEWDSPESKDVLLRRKSTSGEEVAVSALFGGPKVEADEANKADQESPVAADVQMKVCIRKPGLSSILQFDCEVYSRGMKLSRFDIESAYCIPSASSLGSSLFRGPLFRKNGLHGSF
ncbi:OLC1v1036712C2 [Oldenlandia corymbosa var. corymbosa]|uniref:OLC1v1036712C2 n=1 Tax=Oldenlandia corymbosa var. corymbosa TaxID=529605 RepID=A0AAV1CWQ2_OLDCO|nr:OLC1v1036712C2 [Oldenlandia corymbosa var. corymbosa]